MAFYGWPVTPPNGSSPEGGGASASQRPLACTSWKPVAKGSLVGFADIVLPRAGIRFLGCALYEQDGTFWVAPPARERRGSDGSRSGWVNIVEFTSKEARRAWNAAAVAAIQDFRRRHPETDAPPPRGGYEW